MQLQSPSEETDEEGDDTLVDLHILAINPTPLPDNDVIMTDDESLLANQELDPFGSNIEGTPAVNNANESNTQPTSATDVLHLEGEPTLFEFIEQASDEFPFSQLPTFGQDRSPLTVSIEDPPKSTIKKEMSMEAFPPLPSSTMQETTSMTPETLPDGLVCLNGKVYQLVPAPHNVVAATSNIPTPTMIPCTLVSGPTTSVVTPAASSSTASTVASSSVELAVTPAVIPIPDPVAAPTTTALATSPEPPKTGLEFAMPETPPKKDKSLPISVKFSTKREEEVTKNLT